MVLPKVQGLFIGRRGIPKDAKSYAKQLVPLTILLEELNVQLIKWDGIKNHSILDSKRHILVEMAGCPAKDNSWKQVARDASVEMVSVSHTLKLDNKQTTHMRGHFPILHCSFPHGCGPKASLSYLDRAGIPSNSCV
ncbi:hypothetical protein BV25DRAFT_1922399 [Artomyces pyxidatus]|uniref:Uncharacterized protein n=1 Tax=Artomyces pyxidatus TaxID=48021 RepID=A0ACB8SFT4_9AGAM|nr:hypothetical protein BV25DRAFT_1922399 [Artomyces pyxidatus]